MNLVRYFFIDLTVFFGEVLLDATLEFAYRLDQERVVMDHVLSVWVHVSFLQVVASVGQLSSVDVRT